MNSTNSLPVLLVSRTISDGALTMPISSAVSRPDEVSGQ
jgi:hypothetical protein